MNCIIDDILKEGASEYKALLKSKDTYHIIKGKPEESTVYANTIVTTGESLVELFMNLGNKMLDIAGNFLPYIQSFEKLYFETQIGTESSDFISTKLTGFSSTEEQLLLVGERNGKREVIGGLPLESSNFLTANLLRSKLKGKSKVDINKQQFLNLVAKQYDQKLIKANPISLAKDEHTTKDTVVVQTIGDLKKMYGDNFKYLFSSPYIITRRFNSFEDFTGRTVMFYNKFPQNGLSVDAIIRSAGSAGRDSMEKYLGMIPFTLNFHTSLQSLLADFDSLTLEQVDSKASLNALAYHKSILQFYDRLVSEVQAGSGSFAEELSALRIDSSALSVAKIEDTKFTPDIRKLLLHLKHVQNNHTRWFSFMENVLSKMIEESNEARRNLAAGQKQYNAFRGIYVNPQFVQSELGYKSGIAPMDTDIEAVVDKMTITGLHAGAIRPQRLDFKLEEEKDMLNLLSPNMEVKVENIVSAPPLSYSTADNVVIGKEIKPSTSEILLNFEKYGISPQDIEMWVKTMVAETLLSSSNSKFKETILEKLKTKVLLNKDCI